MKTILFSLMAFMAMTACSNTTESNDNNVEQDTTQQTVSNDSDSEKTNEPSNVILGTWIGEMSEEKLTIVIEKLDGTELVGYSILGSNRRNLKGTFTDGAWDVPCSKAYKATLNEPGDDEGDGVFMVKFVGYEDEIETEAGPECKGNLKGAEAQGEWKSKNGEIKKDVYLAKQK